MPATRLYKVRPHRTKTHELLSFVDGVRVALAEFYSMADFSTTALRIPILCPEGCWTQRQLCNGIRYIPIA